MRGQTPVEYVLVIIILLVVLVTIGIGALREIEVSAALAAARTGAGDYAAQNPPVFLTSIAFARNDSSVLFSVRAYNGTARVGDTQALRHAMLSRVARVFQQNASVAPTATTVSGLNYAYYVDFMG